MTKTVLITGCSFGLGRSAARHFAAKGWSRFTGHAAWRAGWENS